jgi:putative ABC transport system permease protein
VGAVVGVVEDFHTASLREEIAPLVLTINRSYRYLAVRVETDDLAGVMGFLEARWKAAEPNRPFVASFLDASFDALYENEARQARLFSAFAVLALTIACIGLLGLAAFAAAQRRKEIGIRKVFGASPAQILLLLSREYVRLVAVAFALVAPVVYYLGSRWLAQFAYRIELDPGVLLLGGAAVLVLALAAVGYQSLKTALADPVESLRHE